MRMRNKVATTAAVMAEAMIAVVVEAEAADVVVVEVAVAVTNQEAAAAVDAATHTAVVAGATQSDVHNLNQWPRSCKIKCWLIKKHSTTSWM